MDYGLLCTLPLFAPKSELKMLTFFFGDFDQMGDGKFRYDVDASMKDSLLHFSRACGIRCYSRRNGKGCFCSVNIRASRYLV